MNKAQRYIDELNVIDKHVTIEAKKCTDKIDRSVLETICSYYTPTEKLMALLTKGATLDANNATGYADNVPSFGSNVPTSDPNVPSSLQTKIDHLGRRVPISQLQEIVIELCTTNQYSASELAQILNRTEYHTIKRIISSLVKERKLFYTIPEMINHPQQKYTSIPKQRSETDGINR